MMNMFADFSPYFCARLILSRSGFGSLMPATYIQPSRKPLTNRLLTGGCRPSSSPFAATVGSRGAGCAAGSGTCFGSDCARGGEAGADCPGGNVDACGAVGYGSFGFELVGCADAVVIAIVETSAVITAAFMTVSFPPPLS